MPSLSSSRIAFLLFLLVALITGGGGHGATAQSSTAPERTVVYANGHVLDGGGFVNRPLVVRDGQFVDAPTEADTTVDLNGGYVIPPFGDAHTHNLGAGGISIRMEEMYLRQGIFYAADLTNPHSAITRELDYLDPPRSIREHFGREQTLDVAYTLGGLTATGSHPAPIMERIYGDDVDSTWSLAGDAYWFLDTMADVREKWPRYIAQGPDLVKVYLMDVGRKLDAGDAERGDRAGCGFGLCPEELRAVVQRAHKAGKRVSAHVNTAADVRLALEAGVDELAHLPLGNDGISVEDSAPYRLRNSTIQRIGEKNMVVVPTALLMVEDVETFPADTLREEIALQRRQVRALHKAGAHLALSGHNWRTTALREATYFHTHEFFDARTLLRLWTTTTSQAIFPDRQIGRLTPGYEASFLVLPRNPIEDFGAVREVRRRIKQGHRLALPQSEGS